MTTLTLIINNIQIHTYIHISKCKCCEDCMKIDCKLSNIFLNIFYILEKKISKQFFNIFTLQHVASTSCYQPF